MNAERRIQRVRKALEPIGHSKPDWEIISAIARAMGYGDRVKFEGPERGISYARLERKGLRWPCPSEDYLGTDILYRDTFGIGPRARLRVIDYQPTQETTDAEFPFLLTTGRTLHQFNAGTMTARTSNALL
jgi:formate dehydrogenase major subunit